MDGTGIDMRSNYLLNTKIAGVEDADLVNTVDWNTTIAMGQTKTSSLLCAIDGDQLQRVILCNISLLIGQNCPHSIT